MACVRCGMPLTHTTNLEKHFGTRQCTAYIVIGETLSFLFQLGYTPIHQNRRDIDYAANNLLRLAEVKIESGPIYYTPAVRGRVGPYAPVAVCDAIARLRGLNLTLPQKAELIKIAYRDETITGEFEAALVIAVLAKD